MGDVISLAQRRRARRPAPSRQRPRATFSFDLASPFTYLAAERAERLFADLQWRPAISEALHRRDLATDPAACERTKALAEERALSLGMPMVWPDGFPDAGRRAMRVASLAAELRRAAPFVLAAGRLAFCGGFDLDEPETLAEAAAAAGLPLDAALEAARDEGRDAAMEAEGRRLLALGADRLPALRAGRLLVCGEERLAEAALAWRSLDGAVAARPLGA
ncbi:MAG: DsbA family protein [Solirubrobacterales bacterium]|nr:DsbA family protein [Solirubrobacterales bacterium]